MIIIIASWATFSRKTEKFCLLNSLKCFEYFMKKMMSSEAVSYLC